VYFKLTIDAAKHRVTVLEISRERQYVTVKFDHRLAHVADQAHD